METSKPKLHKPTVLRIIFILNAVLTFLPLIFYYIVTSKDINVGYDPVLMLYTAGGYSLIFIVMVISILKKNLMVFRSVFVISFLISIPAKAYIGMLFVLISFALTFHKKIKAYFKTH